MSHPELRTLTIAGNSVAVRQGQAEVSIELRDLFAQQAAKELDWVGSKYGVFELHRWVPIHAELENRDYEGHLGIQARPAVYALLSPIVQGDGLTFPDDGPAPTRRKGVLFFSESGTWHAINAWALRDGVTHDLDLRGIDLVATVVSTRAQKVSPCHYGGANGERKTVERYKNITEVGVFDRRIGKRVETKAFTAKVRPCADSVTVGDLRDNSSWVSDGEVIDWLRGRYEAEPE